MVYGACDVRVMRKFFNKKLNNMVWLHGGILEKKIQFLHFESTIWNTPPTIYYRKNSDTSDHCTLTYISRISQK